MRLRYWAKVLDTAFPKYSKVWFWLSFAIDIMFIAFAVWIMGNFSCSCLCPICSDSAINWSVFNLTMP